jgi:hypothetical protein
VAGAELDGDVRDSVRVEDASQLERVAHYVDLGRNEARAVVGDRPPDDGRLKGDSSSCQRSLTMSRPPRSSPAKRSSVPSLPSPPSPISTRQPTSRAPPSSGWWPPSGHAMSIPRTSWLEAARGEHNRLIDLYQAGLIDMPELHRRATAITTRQRELEQKRATLAAQRADLARGNRLRHGVEHFAGRVRAVTDQLDHTQRQALLRLLIEDVQVTGWHIKIRLRIPLDQPPGNDHPRGRTPRPSPAPDGSATSPVSTEDSLRSLHVHERTQLPAQQKTRARRPHREGGDQVKQEQARTWGIT